MKHHGIAPQFDIRCERSARAMLQFEVMRVWHENRTLAQVHASTPVIKLCLDSKIRMKKMRDTKRINMDHVLPAKPHTIIR